MESNSPLPDVSRASATKGLWLVFKDDDRIIRAWGSYWTGLERIFVNDQLILSSPTRGEVFQFEYDNDQYRIEFSTKSVAMGQLHCCFFKNGTLLSELHSKRRKIINIRPIVAHITTCVGFGFTAGLLQFPVWSGLFFITLSFGVTLLSNAKTDTFIIEKRQPPETQKPSDQISLRFKIKQN